MKVYWDKTAVIGLVGFMISLLLILCFMDRLSYPLVGIFLCLFGILLCGQIRSWLKSKIDPKENGDWVWDERVREEKRRKEMEDYCNDND